MGDRLIPISHYADYLKSWTTVTPDDEMPDKSDSGLVTSTGKLVSERFLKKRTKVGKGLRCPCCKLKLSEPHFRPTTRVYSRNHPLTPSSGQVEYRSAGRGYVIFCPSCGWWRATVRRTDHTHSWGPTYQTEATYDSIIRHYALSDTSIPTDGLRAHLKKHAEDLCNISPHKFERIVQAVLSDYFSCEVKHLGGPNDKGIDLYAVIRDEPYMIQVKRRQSIDRAESVSTVREFIAATLLKGGRRGAIVTTAGRFSRQAQETAAQAALLAQEVELDLISFKDIYSILSITTLNVEHALWSKF